MQQILFGIKADSVITFSKLGIYGESRLGNQMFQYAAAKSASLKANSLFAIPFENQELSDCFNLNCHYYSLPKEQNSLSTFTQYYEGRFEYENRFNDIEDETDLNGYFQSEKYFARYAETILRDFTFKKTLQNKAMEYIDSLRTDRRHLVSVHVRRSDYINLQNFHPLCSLDYYLKAMNIFEDADFVVFSDDMNWCMENLKGNSIFYSELKTHQEDLCAMSLCNHHIIANSSFSWWGAWLNRKAQKSIVAPVRWFGPDYSDKKTCDLFGKNWIVL